MCLDSSYSWSTNIVGRKLWYLFPPNVTHCLRTSPENRRSERIFNVRAVDVSQFPQWPQAEEKMIIVEQHVSPNSWWRSISGLHNLVHSLGRLFLSLQGGIIK